MARWLYDHTDPGTLGELNLDLQPGDEFDAPDDWLPEPNPHPVYKPTLRPVSKPNKEPAPPAPQE
jgi:hypothetical protein